MQAVVRVALGLTRIFSTDLLNRFIKAIKVEQFQ